MQVPLSPRVSPRALTAGQHDGRPLLALAMRPYAYLLPSRRARSLVLALTACGVLLCAAARLVQAGMCWSCGISQPSSRRLHWCLLSRCTWLWTTPFRCAASCSSTRALAWRALLLCVSRRVRSLRHRVCSSGSCLVSTGRLCTAGGAWWSSVSSAQQSKHRLLWPSSRR